jgi:two-component system, OmpR family, sensor kinase
MNRLWFRITLALVGVTLLSVVALTVVAQINTTTQFTQLVDRQRAIAQSSLIDALGEHYTATGSWAGADALLNAAMPNFPRAGFGPQQGPPADGPGSGVRRGRGATSFLLVDAASKTVARGGAQTLTGTLSAEQLAAALPIEVNAQVVGRLIVTSPESSLLSEAQQVVLSQLRRYGIVAALIVSAVAIAVGVLISRALTAPLAQLAASAQALSNRRWDARAGVQGAQEIAEVAQAFNHMADSLQQAEVNRRNLTADIAHELRTPLTVIQGNLRAMLDEVYPVDRTEIATIYDETRLLSRLVDDLRLLALAEAGQLNLQPKPEVLQDLLTAAGAQFQIAAEGQDVRLDVQIPVDAVRVLADADRAAQVLRNLISNALRHTPAGGAITLAATIEDRFARVRVSDTGEGIPADALPHIFDRFYRADPSRTRGGAGRPASGSGLGLAIVQSLVQTMGGQVGAESNLGKGSTLWFTLPLAPS